MNQRGLSPVLGLVLLVGVTAIASMAILFVGMSLADTTQSSAEYEQVEQSMAQLAESGDRVAAGDANRARFTIEGGDSGQVRAVSDAGTINVTVTNRLTGNVTMTLERSLGAVIYETGDGTEVAYQGGGVWRQDPSGQSTLVRSPEFHYRSNPEDTITFPIMLVRDDFSASGQVSGDVVAQAAERHYPDRPNHYNPLEDGSVRIQIDSEYCEGWEEYFREHTDGSAAEGCDAGTEGELEIQFSVPFHLDGAGGGVMYGGGDFDPDDYSGVDDSNVSDSSGAPSATSLVDSKIEDCEDSGDELNGRTFIDQPGLYCADDGEMDGGNEFTFDTSNGDIGVAIDGDLYETTSGSNSGIEVLGDGNLTLFVRGDGLEDGGSQSMTIGNESDPSQTRIFVHSEADTFGDEIVADVYALIYAPNTDVSFKSGAPTFDGAVVADNLDAHHNMDFFVDSETANLSFHYELGDAPFYYLHISETEVHVERD